MAPDDVADMRRWAQYQAIAATKLPPMWVVYAHPSDFPDHWVVRRWDGPDKPAHRPTVHASLEIAREAVQDENPGAFNLGRQPTDDPAIYEVWI
jgi:NADH:ubiquinone oxidoreductase subunit